MRVIFMGTPSFAVPALKMLYESEEHELVAVFTRADAVRGRGKKLVPSDVKHFAVEHGIDVYTPQTLRDKEVTALIKNLEPDIIVVAAYGAILSKEIFEIPAKGCINLHASLLPCWRGAAPIQRAVLAGDSEVGICLMKMEEGLDTGDFCELGRVPVDNKSCDELSLELAELGAQGLMEALPKIQYGTYLWCAQDDSETSYAEKISKAEVLLSPVLSVKENLRRIQVSSKSCPARCVICGKEVTVCAAQESDERVEAGKVLLPKKRVLLGAMDGAIELLEVKPMGKQAMPVISWRAGLHTDNPYWQSIE